MKDAIEVKYAARSRVQRKSAASNFLDGLLSETEALLSQKVRDRHIDLAFRAIDFLNKFEYPGLPVVLLSHSTPYSGLHDSDVKLTADAVKYQTGVFEYHFVMQSSDPPERLVQIIWAV
jgi:hypothetical protein